MVKPRALVVEDQALLAIELEILLAEAGFEVVGTAMDSANALGLVRARRPDLALLDLNLNDGLTGPRVAATMADEKLGRALFVTGQANLLPNDLHGALAVIDKPFELGAMTAGLRYLAALIAGADPPPDPPRALRFARG